MSGPSNEISSPQGVGSTSNGEEGGRCKTYLSEQLPREIMDEIINNLDSLLTAKYVLSRDSLAADITRLGPVRSSRIHPVPVRTQNFAAMALLLVADTDGSLSA